MQRSYPQYIDFISEETALTLWKNGEVVAIPTETVYGLAADAECDLAVARIYSMKSRPSFNPLIIHVAGVEMAKKYAVWNARAEMLAQKFWPGPLTLVLPTRTPTALSTLALAGGETVALRVPAHPVARRLIEQFGHGIAAPSANKSGRVSPTSAMHVRAEFGDALPIIDGGACMVGLESTVVDLTGDAPVILRPGAVTRAMLALSSPHSSRLRGEMEGGIREEMQAGGVITSSPPPLAPKSPGQLAAHYAPSIPLRRNATHVAADEALLAFGTNAPQGAAQMLNLSPTGDLVEAAANLFACLRALDDARHCAIAVMPIPDDGLGEAINDRLMRAEAGSIAQESPPDA
jgi:L-threonylcarbamoyladenylate synthase